MTLPCIIGLDEPRIFEVNHIPNVTRFPEIWEGYVDYVVTWLSQS